MTPSSKQMREAERSHRNKRIRVAMESRKTRAILSKRLAWVRESVTTLIGLDALLGIPAWTAADIPSMMESRWREEEEVDSWHPSASTSALDSAGTASTALSEMQDVDEVLELQRIKRRVKHVSAPLVVQATVVVSDIAPGSHPSAEPALY